MSYGFNAERRAYCYWYEGKKKRATYFGFGDLALEQARRLDEQKKQEKGKIKVASGPTVTQICQAYTLQHVVEKTTAESDEYRLESIILPILGNLRAEEITTKHLNDYVLQRLQDGRKMRTIDRELDILKASFNWAQAQDPPLIFRNPISKYSITCNDDEVPAPPNTEEVKRILKHSPRHLIRAILINWHCFCRPGGEISRITWVDVDFVTNKVRIVSARKGGPATRYVPMSPEFRELMLRWRTEDEEGLKVTRRKNKPEIFNLQVIHHRYKAVLSLKRAWAEAKRKAKIKRRLRLYDLRHAGITIALEEGADLKAVSEVAGHSRPDTTMRCYQHVTKDQHRSAVAKIPCILNYSTLEHSIKNKVKKTQS